MTEFVCRVGRPDGAIAERMIRAPSALKAREALEADGLAVFDVDARSGRLQRILTSPLGGVAGDESRSSGLGRRRRKIATADLLLLNQELAALVAAGLPLLRCLDILRSRRAGSPTGDMLDRVRAAVAHGDALSGAFHREIALMGVPELFVTALEIGEASGDLESNLRRFAAHLDRVQTLRSRVRSALMYPMALLGVAGVVVMIIVTVVIPRFAGFYSAYDAELPLATRMLVATAGLISGYGLLGGAVALALGLLVAAWLRTPRGSRWRDEFALRLPLLGSLRRRYLDLETARTLETLLRGGAPLVRALEVTASGTGNSAYRQRILNVRQRVSEGTPLHGALEHEGLMEPMGLEMVQVGESTGSLENMLEHVGRTYDDVLERQLATAIGLLEPAMLVVMGLVVAGILLSLYLPLFRTVQVVG